MLRQILLQWNNSCSSGDAAARVVRDCTGRSILPPASARLHSVSAGFGALLSNLRRAMVRCMAAAGAATIPTFR
jgi:hypothetical protein